MRVFLFLFGLFQAAALSSKLKSLIQKVQDSKDAETETVSVVAGVFDVAGFDDEETTGNIAIKVCTHNPTKIHLTKAQQQSSWIQISDLNSPMQSGKWKPAANGIRLENQQGEQLHCAASEGKVITDALLVTFACEAHKDLGEKEPRFVRAATSFWQPCPDGHVPYGWPSQWGEFDFPYYAITDTGFLGCSYVNADGYCFESKDGAAIHANFGYNDSPSNKPVSFFPFDTYSTGDLIPGSRFYTSPQPTRGMSRIGATTSTQPPLSSDAGPNPSVVSTPMTTASIQPVPPPPVPDTLKLIPITSGSPPFQVDSPRFRTQTAVFSTSSPPFTFGRDASKDSFDEKLQAAAKKEEELEKASEKKPKKIEEEDDDE